MVKFSPKAIAELHRWSQSQPAASSTETWTVPLSKVSPGPTISNSPPLQSLTRGQP